MHGWGGRLCADMARDVLTWPLCVITLMDMDTTFQMRVGSDTVSTWREAAERHGCSLADLVRRAMDAELRREAAMDITKTLNEELEARRDVIVAGLRARHEAEVRARVRMQLAAEQAEQVDDDEIREVLTEWERDAERDVAAEHDDMMRDAYDELR